MEIFVFCVYLFAVYEFTSGQNSGVSDLTPRQVLSELNSMHTDFPNKMIKPILMELEKSPKLMNDIKNKDLELRAAHDTNSVIKLNPANTSAGTGSLHISHAANSEFQMKPQRSNGIISIKRNALEKVSTDLSKQNKIYILNLPSQTFQENDIKANNHGIIYDVPTSVRKLQILSANAVDNLPQGILYSNTNIQPRLGTSIFSISSTRNSIEPQVKRNLVTGTFTLTDQQTQMVSGPTSVNMITNPRRVVLLRRFLPRGVVLPTTNTIPVLHVSEVLISSYSYFSNFMNKPPVQKKYIPFGESIFLWGLSKLQRVPY